MQREVIDGVPYWSDKERNVYYFDINADPKAILLGTKSAEGKLNLLPNWEQQLAESLSKFRGTVVGRSRKPQKPSV